MARDPRPPRRARAARDAWSRRLASHPADSAALDDAALASLLFFARPDSSADAHLVAAACVAAFPETITHANANENANDSNDANADADGDGEDANGDDFTPTRARSFAVIRVGADATETARARLRARRLAAFALTALHAVDRATSDEAFAAMTRAVLRAVDPEAWRAGGATRDAAETLARATLGDLFVRDGASRSLRALARRASDAVYAANTRDDSTIRANGHSRIAATRRLVGTMCARVVATRADANARVDDRLFPRMLATPRVWSTGAAVETTWRFAAESLADLKISECTSDREFGTARDAGWILANLAEAAPAGIANERCAKGRWRAATTFAEAAADAIAKLPADVVFGRGDGDDATSDGGVSSESDEGESSDEDETARFASARRRSAGAASKSWTKDVDVARRLARLVDWVCDSSIRRSVESASVPTPAADFARVRFRDFARVRFRDFARVRFRDFARVRFRDFARVFADDGVRGDGYRSSRGVFVRRGGVPPTSNRRPRRVDVRARVRHAVHPPRVDGDSNASRVSPPKLSRVV